MKGYTLKKNLPGTNAAFDSIVPTPLAQAKVDYDEATVASVARARAALARLDAKVEDASEGTRTRLAAELAREEAECTVELATHRFSRDHALPSMLLAYQPSLDAGGTGKGGPSASDDAFAFGKGALAAPAPDDADDVAAADKADKRNAARALDYAYWRAQRLPLVGRLFQEVHGIMLEPPGHEKLTPGWYRTSPVWMGNPGATISDAVFVAPTGDDMHDALGELEAFVNAPDDGLDPLVRTALAHYQFETVHPFLDGNGRVGRVLVQLMLKDRGLLHGVDLPLSWAFEQQEFAYYTAYLRVQQRAEYNGWVRFFCDAVARAAAHAQERLDACEGKANEA